MNESVALRKSGTAWTLSFFAPGAGHIYCGQFGKGLLIYVLEFVCTACAPLLLLPLSTTLMWIAAAIVAAGAILWLYAMIDAPRVARRVNAQFRPRDYNRWYFYAVLILVYVPFSVGFAFHIRAAAYEAFYVAGDNMQPTLKAGERVVVSKLAYRREAPARGDVVVAQSPREPGRWLIRRVVAVAGDRVEISDGQVRVDAQAMGQLAAASSVPTTAPETRSWHLDRGQVFLLNENLARGDDSRSFGPVPLSTIVGRVERVYLPTIRRVSR